VTGNQGGSDQAIVGELKCLTCGKTRVCTEGDILQYTVTRIWPHCCNETMAYISYETGVKKKR